MSAPISDPILQAILPSGILVASLLGSAHCVGMCGGLVISFVKDTKSLGLYHLGRLLSYASLGAIAGALGNSILNAPISKQLPWVASTAFGILLIGVGVRRLSGKPLHLLFPKSVSLISANLIQRSLRGSSAIGVFTLGALSAFLPCGWLYTFVLGATATKSAILGAAALSLFWLGTVPALSAAPALFNRFTTKIRGFTPKISAALMIGLGLFSLSLHASALIDSALSPPKTRPTTLAPSCPLHHLRGN
ncbi:MAG: sulfite exporter TauE/SafE family protein [Deltaproteobacteria bacterium]|nr:sulfite exporter TauE/SafE family protein [Deltaproteobacteria bacterium]